MAETESSRKTLSIVRGQDVRHREHHDLRGPRQRIDGDGIADHDPLEHRLLDLARARGAEKSACVAHARTRSAPASATACAALQSVPALSIMSSEMIATLS